MYFPSKKDTWVAIIIWGIVLLFIYSIFDGDLEDASVTSIVLQFVITSLLVGFLLWLWFGTGYKVEGGFIMVKSGPFKSKIRIKEIKSLTATKNPISAPALSIDRIEIMYGQYEIAIISPKNKADFIQVLSNENPNIQVDKKLLNK